ncbi:hypothetical protein BD293_0067 [Roseinatronobacter monicus]|uniref:Lipoprotein n=1 Tax=Roseinatronobacter monicus TaxID=393481 RepID=A0A543K8Y4_9RHOB|nr:hypothetical protein BD293_0067 [Roseinatronobacter monicus]
MKVECRAGLILISFVGLSACAPKVGSAHDPCVMADQQISAKALITNSLTNAYESCLANLRGGYEWH